MASPAQPIFRPAVRIKIPFYSDPIVIELNERTAFLALPLGGLTILILILLAMLTRM